MRSTSVVSAAALCLVSACADNIPVQPTTAALSAYSATASVKVTGDEQLTIVNPSLGDLVVETGRPAGNYRIVRAELLRDVSAVHAASATLIIASDSGRLEPDQWVKGDPRRGGQPGLTWGYLGMNAGARMYDPAFNGSVRPALAAELESRVVEAMAAWENLGCSGAPITRLFPGSPLPPDIFHVGWFPPAWFEQQFGPGVLGVTLTSVFIDPATGEHTDIDGDGRDDVAFQDILYNAGPIWSDNGPMGTMDLFTIIAHESGHAFGLNHRGKVFATKKDVIMTAAGPTVRAEDIKFAPKALMNPIYVAGRTDITGVENSTFCQVWGGR